MTHAPVAQWIERWIPNRSNNFFKFHTILITCIKNVFNLTFGFVWNHLEIFDLDGHNLGTISAPHQKWNFNPLLQNIIDYDH